MPQFSVTWPTRPGGVYSQFVHATGPTEAVRVAAELDWPTSPGYSVAFDYEPEVWILRRPYRLRSRHVQGPQFSDCDPNQLAFTPIPATT
ncbi:hypothetical protein [Streptomyces sp. NPDC048669]|uniref:hypothetical protein n=1 Tax=Streptomyces sp. NPDC048669 TaxID=3155267 RepID=UPI0034385CA0